MLERLDGTAIYAMLCTYIHVDDPFSRDRIDSILIYVQLMNIIFMTSISITCECHPRFPSKASNPHK